MGAPTGPSPQTPRHVALVDASATAPTSTLLADAAEALPVYAWLAGAEEPKIENARPGEDLADCDTVLLALELERGAVRIERLPVGHAPAEVRVYALVCTEEDPEVGSRALTALERCCEERGLSWMGGLVVGDANLLPRISGRPRMGWARRRVSEAVDQLLIALLAAEPAGERYVRPSRYAHLTCRPR